MLWRYRKEILLLFFLALALFVGIKFSHSQKIFRIKKSLVLSSPENSISHPVRYLRSTRNYQRLKLEKVFIDELLIENKRLRKILQLKEKNPYQFKRAARVIRMDPVGWPTTILIDSGQEESIEEGMTVLDQNGSLVGRVARVDKNTSLVMTLLHPESKVSGLVQHTREAGILQGGHSGVLELKYLAKESKAQKGDLMLTSGLSTLYPDGLPIGKVLKVKEKGPSLFLEVVINPAVSFAKLEEVLIIQ